MNELLTERYIMLKISQNVSIPIDEIYFSAIRAQGAGGQNVNKVSSAIHLQFDINASSLPVFYKLRLLKLKDRRISNDGVVTIKAQRFRTQQKNRDDAIERLQDLIKSVATIQKKRIPTKATRGSQQKRMDSKTKRGKLKATRAKVIDY